MTSASTRSGRARAQRRQRRVAVAHRLDVPARPEQARHVLAHVGVVVGDHDAEAARAARRVLGRRRRDSTSTASSAAGSQPSASSTKDRRRSTRSRSRSRRRSARAADAPGPRGSVTVKALPRPGCALDAHLAAVQAHQLLHQRQADAGALVRAARARSRRGGSGRRRGRARPAAMPMPVSRTRSTIESPRSASSTAIAALEGELEGVGEEVEDDLLPHVAIDVHGLGGRRDSAPRT